MSSRPGVTRSRRRGRASPRSVARRRRDPTRSGRQPRRRSPPRTSGDSSRSGSRRTPSSRTISTSMCARTSCASSTGYGISGNNGTAASDQRRGAAAARPPRRRATARARRLLDERWPDLPLPQYDVSPEEETPPSGIPVVEMQSAPLLESGFALPRPSLEVILWVAVIASGAARAPRLADEHPVQRGGGAARLCRVAVRGRPERAGGRRALGAAPLPD